MRDDEEEDADGDVDDVDRRWELVRWRALVGRLREGLRPRVCDGVRICVRGVRGVYAGECGREGVEGREGKGEGEREPVCE